MMNKNKLIAIITLIGLIATILLNYGANYYGSLKDEELSFYLITVTHSVPAGTVNLMNNTFPVLSENANNYYLNMFKDVPDYLEEKMNKTISKYEKYRTYEANFSSFSFIAIFISFLSYIYLLRNWDELK